jgi:hypothetical protein
VGQTIGLDLKIGAAQGVGVPVTSVGTRLMKRTML